MAMLKYVLCLAVLAVSLKSVRAEISKESKLAIAARLQNSMNECAKEFPVDLDDLKERHKPGHNYDGIDKCFFRCITKNVGVINDEGKYESEKGLEAIRAIIKDVDDVKFLEKVGQACVSVNDEEVSDGDKGCERAALLFSCFKKHKVYLE